MAIKLDSSSGVMIITNNGVKFSGNYSVGIEGDIIEIYPELKNFDKIRGALTDFVDESDSPFASIEALEAYLLPYTDGEQSALTNAELRASAVSIISTPVSAGGSITTQNLAPTGTATAGSAIEIDLNGMSQLAIQTEGTYTGALSIQVTNGTRWETVTATLLNNFLAGTWSATISSGTVGVFIMDVSAFKKVRLTALAAVTGSASILMRAISTSMTGVTRPMPAGTNAIGAVTQSGTWTMQPGNTANTTAWLTTDVKSAAQGFSTYHLALNTAASTMATSVKASAGTVNFISVSNNNATTAYFLKIYNKASAPTVGTDTPVHTFRIPANNTTVLNVSDLRLSTGLAYAVTSGATTADTGTIATANDIIVTINYI